MTSSKIVLASAAALALLALAPVARAEDLFVIANSGTALAPGDLRDVYLGEKQFAGTAKLVPVDNAAAQADFLAKVLHMEAPKYATAWTKKSFRDGSAAPQVKGSDTETLEFVKHTPGSVGYVHGSEPAGVTVVGKF